MILKSLGHEFAHEERVELISVKPKNLINVVYPQRPRLRYYQKSHKLNMQNPGSGDLQLLGIYNQMCPQSLSTNTINFLSKTKKLLSSMTINVLAYHILLFETRIFNYNSLSGLFGHAFDIFFKSPNFMYILYMVLINFKNS